MLSLFPAIASGALPDPVLHPTPVPTAAGVTVIPLTLPGGPAETASCLSVYDNTVNFTGLFDADQQGREAVDDLHMVEGGSLCSFAFGYNQPGSSSFQAVITFYANDGQDLPPYTEVAGPYIVTGLPPGTNAIVVTPPTGPVVGSDLWMGVRFSSTVAGLLISDPPATGSSHDYFYYDPPGDYFYFGGNPRANFYLRVEVESAVPVAPATWGSLKSRHR